MIPDGIIDTRSMAALGPCDYLPNRLVGLETMVEMTTVACINESNEAREQRFLNDVLKRIRTLDSKFQGSTFEQTLKSFGLNGKYLVLVDAPSLTSPRDLLPLSTSWLEFALSVKSAAGK